MSRQRTINVGVQIRNAIDSYLDTYPGLEVSLLDSIGKPLGDTRIPAERVDGLRVRVSKLLCRTLGHTLLEGQWEFFNEPVENGYCKTSLRHAFLKLWAKAIDDPAADVVDWLETGAPAGITVHPKLEGIWPPVEGDEAKIESEFFPQISNLSTTMQGLKKILQLFLPPRDILKKGYLRPFDSLDECRSALGGFEPVLSRLGCISTEKHTSDGGTVIKNRIILDAKQSEVTSATSREYRSVMPRLTYAVTDALCMMSNLEEDETLEQLIADISDAFWLIPLHPKERRFFVASFQGKFLVFERTAKGSRGAPLTFCTIMGLATRLLQSLLVYTGDPWIIAKGTPTQEAKGVVRTLECICDTCKFCPVHLLSDYVIHLLSDYVSRLKRVFVHEMGMDFDKLPLFPRADGTALSKEAVNHMLCQIVKKYGGRVDDEAGRSCISVLLV
eukprot:s436_g13.t1